MADQTLQEIKDRLNIADFIAGYIPIKKAGGAFKAVCPFHSEKTPSLMISPSKQIWHCFGCGEGGDVFGFVMRYENLDFKEALKLLAEKAGVPLLTYKPVNPQEQTEKELLLRINDFASRFYYEILTKDKLGEKALEYLKDRGLTLETIKHWQIGYAPEGFHNLEAALSKKKISTDLLIKAGLSAKNERGQIYDRFRGRITFPIFDYQGKTVGFSARIFNDDGKSAKYINSPETLIYQKSKILFGLNFAKNSIRKADEAVVVEGQMDCVLPHQAGFENVIATSGTALTIEQLNLLARLTKNLKFCFDADTAGEAASRRAGEMALKQGFRLKVIILEKVKDPDELVTKSPGLWEKAVKEAIWFLDWQMDLAEKKYAGDPVEQNHFLTESVMPLLAAVKDPLEQDHYVKRMVERFDVSERTIREQLKRLALGLPRAAEVPQAVMGSAFSKINTLEKEVLGGMLKYKAFSDLVLSRGEIEDFESPEVREIVKQLFQGQKDGSLLSTIAKEALFMVESELETLENNGHVLERQLNKSFAKLRLNAIKRKQGALTLEIKRAEGFSDKAKLSELNKTFAELSNLRLEFEQLT